MKAEKLLDEKYEGNSIWGDLQRGRGDVFYEDDVIKAMKEYAKIKCQELLEIVVEKARLTSENSGEINERRVVDKDSILSAVDLEQFIV
jgi:hypothetical protein